MTKQDFIFFTFVTLINCILAVFLILKIKKQRIDYKSFRTWMLEDTEKRNKCLHALGTEFAKLKFVVYNIPIGKKGQIYKKRYFISDVQPIKIYMEPRIEYYMNSWESLYKFEYTVIDLKQNTTYKLDTLELQKTLSIKK